MKYPLKYNHEKLFENMYKEMRKTYIEICQTGKMKNIR